MRDFLAGLFIFGFLPLWIAFMAYVTINFNPDKVELIGLGTMNGVFIAAFKDMIQFYFRKAKSSS